MTVFLNPVLPADGKEQKHAQGEQTEKRHPMIIMLSIKFAARKSLRFKLYPAAWQKQRDPEQHLTHQQRGSKE